MKTNASKVFAIDMTNGVITSFSNQGVSGAKTYGIDFLDVKAIFGGRPANHLSMEVVSPTLEISTNENEEFFIVRDSDVLVDEVIERLYFRRTGGSGFSRFRLNAVVHKRAKK